MSDILSSVPQEIQDEAVRYADELWQALADELGRGYDLEPLKARVVGYLKLAFIRGCLSTLQIGLDTFKNAVAARSNHQLN